MRKHKFPVVLLCLVLVLAILVSGVTVPGFLLPLFGRTQGASPTVSGQSATEETITQDALDSAVGNSKAFTLQPVEGMTVSAPENALDRDREVRVSAATEEELDAALSTVSEALPEPLLVLDAWEFDMGLEDDDLLPGEVEIALDLEALGVDEAYYEAVSVYRVDDSGKWYEYASSLEGSTLRVKTRQNSLIVTAILWTLIVGGVMKSIDLGVNLNYGGYVSVFRDGYPVYVDGVKRFLIVLDASMVKKVMETSELGLKGHQEELLIEAEEKAILQAVKESVLDKAQQQEIKKQGEHYTIGTVCKQIFSYDPVEAKWIKKRAMVLSEKYAKELLSSDPSFSKMKDQYDNFNSRTDTRDLDTLKEALEQVKKTEEFLQLAYKYLRDEIHVNVHTYVMEVQLSAQYSTSSYGAMVAPYLGHPYLLIYMERVGAGTKRGYDGLLLTLVHEMFHAVQRSYVMDSRANYAFDEMSAQVVEWAACEYFSGEGVISTSKDVLLENLRNAKYFAIPLDSYSTSYPEGKLSGEKASVSYPRAPFLKYLLEHCDGSYASYDTMLRRYKSLFGHRALTTILKYCFDLSEQGFTDAYLDYAKSDQARFYRAALQADIHSVFAPIADTKDGKSEVKLLNKNYTIRVRRVRVSKRDDKDKQFALVVRYNDDYKSVMSDFELTPMNMERNEQYKDWEHGIFIEPRGFSKDPSTPSVYLLEADGGSASSTEGYIYNTYSGYTLYPLYELPEPDYEITGGELIVQPPEPPKGATAEIVDSVVITLMLDKTQMLFEQVKYDGWEEPWTCKLSDLELDGKKLTQEQIDSLSFSWQQCVTGTFEYGPCLGPGEPIPLEPGVDITGTWEMHSEGSNIDMEWLYSYLEMMPEELKEQYADYFAMLRTSSGDFEMEVTKAGKDASYGYEVQFVYPKEYQAAPFPYEGVFNEDSMQLTLHPKDPGAMTNDLILRIVKDGTSLTCAGETDYSSSFVSYNAAVTGKKRS